MTATVTRAERDRLTRLLIAERLGLPVAAIGPAHEWEFNLGSLDDGAACVTWYRDYKPARTETAAGSEAR
ncbi:MAG: hypothetical protein M3Y58_12315 [Chloroflexota bacterium]|nr:hypothetical protein [Chloroflexota bacterium]